MPDVLNRYLGGMMGVAAGDALGGTTELMWYDEIAEKYGVLRDIIGGGKLGLDPGEVTDDTYMTIAVAKGILKSGAMGKWTMPYDAIGDEFLAWIQSDYVNDVGKTVSRTIRHYYQTRDWFSAARLTDEQLGGLSDGNGSVMRCVPVPLAYAGSEETALEIAYRQSKLTHYGELAGETCKIYTRIILDILDGAELKEAFLSGIRGSEYEHLAPATFETVPANAYIKHTFRWVQKVIMEENSFEDIIIRAANNGGDSDTIAAIAGGLAGVYYGYEAIPERWKEKILRRTEIETLARKLYQFNQAWRRIKQTT